MILLEMLQRQKTPNKAEEIRDEIARLKTWFANEYAYKAQKYERCRRMDIPCDVDIAALDAEAEEKRARINALEEELQNANKTTE